LRRDRILDVEQVLKSDAINENDEIEFSDWRKELKKKGYAEMEIQALFSRYDRDQDGKLNQVEKVKLLRDVSKAKNNVAQEFSNFKLDHKVVAKKDAFE
jgi:polycystin 2